MRYMLYHKQFEQADFPIMPAVNASGLTSTSSAIINDSLDMMHVSSSAIIQAEGRSSELTTSTIDLNKALHIPI
jgi:hypothetical protein